MTDSSGMLCSCMLSPLTGLLGLQALAVWLSSSAVAPMHACGGHCHGNAVTSYCTRKYISCTLHIQEYLLYLQVSLPIGTSKQANFTTALTARKSRPGNAASSCNRRRPCTRFCPSLLFIFYALFIYECIVMINNIYFFFHRKSSLRVIIIMDIAVNPWVGKVTQMTTVHGILLKPHSKSLVDNIFVSVFLCSSQAGGA